MWRRFAIFGLMAGLYILDTLVGALLFSKVLQPVLLKAGLFA